MFMARSASPSASSLALSNLRAITILIVIAFHAMLAYLIWIPLTVGDFSSPPWPAIIPAWLIGAPRRAVATSWPSCGTPSRDQHIMRSYLHPALWLPGRLP
jgi:hypothetical protein